MKRVIQCAALIGALSVSGAAFSGQPATTPPTYNDNPGQQEANSHVGRCDSYDGSGTVTGAGAGGFGWQSGPGNNQAGGNRDEPNYNPMICGNPNDNALVRGPD